jgi:ABC-type branched-subunit amino acid transport system permease subunit
MTGRRAVAWILFLIAAAAAIGLFPQFFELFTVINATIYASMGILTLSLALIWGYCGIISFGQTAFFGLGGYTYAVAAINLGDSTWAIVLGLLIPTLFAALLGYFMFWGRVTDVYLGVITLTVSLILYKLFNATAGDAYHIGKAALGGFNGIRGLPGSKFPGSSATPLINLPWDPDTTLEVEDIWYVAASLLCVSYIFVRWVLSTNLGHLMVAIRENEPNYSATTRGGLNSLRSLLAGPWRAPRAFSLPTACLSARQCSACSTRRRLLSGLLSAGLARWSDRFSPVFFYKASLPSWAGSTGLIRTSSSESF